MATRPLPHSNLHSMPKHPDIDGNEDTITISSMSEYEVSSIPSQPHRITQAELNDIVRIAKEKSRTSRRETATMEPFRKWCEYNVFPY